MAQKHLHELLQEDQEPFYIAKRHINFSTPKTSSLQVKKIQKPIINQTPTSKFCKNTCFSSFHDSPDLRKSPLYLPSPAPVKCQENGKFVLHVPARTATLLLEAAMRIQKQQSSSKAKKQIKKVKFGVFGSILKRLKDRNGTKDDVYNRSDTLVDLMHGETFSTLDCSFSKDRKDTLVEMLSKTACDETSWSSTLAEMLSTDSYDRSLRSSPFLEPTNIMYDESLNIPSCPCNNKGVLNIENKEEKFMDLENYRNNGDFSPFRFSLQRCSSSGDVMPEFKSPAASPMCHKKEDKEKYETIIALTSTDKVEEEDENEKEQCSPVSVLDPPFEEEEDGHVGAEVEEEDSDLDCSYAHVQRAQQQLLHKLRRFEKLAELDPIELEKLLLEEEDDNENRVECQVSNLIFEEKSDIKSLNYGEAVFGRECKRLDLSLELRSNNTIDMVVKSDLKNEFDSWNEFQEQREETAIEFAFSILGLLVEELEEELIHLVHS
ncbi:putative protein isoform X1 [Capsicum chacoense]